MRRRVLELFGLVLVGVIALAGGSAQTAGLKIVASTSWVAAVAEAAGATDVEILAPFELRHPPEYDFRPSDPARVRAAAYVLHAGYEPFIQKMLAAGLIAPEKLIQVRTVNVPAILTAEARKLAKIFGTEDQERQWEHDFTALAAAVQKRARDKGFVGRRALVHKFFIDYAAWLGLDNVGTFGGGEELTAVQMAALIAAQPELIVDNWHNQQGQGIARETGADYALLINFPGHGGTRSLIDVFRYDAEQLGLN